jgi:hypothetical protein
MIVEAPAVMVISLLTEKDLAVVMTAELLLTEMVSLTVKDVLVVKVVIAPHALLLTEAEATAQVLIVLPVHIIEKTEIVHASIVKVVIDHALLLTVKVEIVHVHHLTVKVVTDHVHHSIVKAEIVHVLLLIEKVVTDHVLLLTVKAEIVHAHHSIVKVVIVHAHRLIVKVVTDHVHHLIVKAETVHVHRLIVKVATDHVLLLIVKVEIVHVLLLIARISLGEEMKIKKVKEAIVQDSVVQAVTMAIQLFPEMVEDVQDSPQVIQDLKGLHVRFVEEVMIMIQMLSIAKRKELSIKSSSQIQMNQFV